MIFIRLGAFFAFLAVALGAFGAHALKNMLGADLSVFHTAASYMMYHALALVLFGLFQNQHSKKRQWPGWLFFLGIIMFCGSLFLIVFTHVSAFGAVAPVGGACFLAGWIGFLFSAG
jgi:uncharacterized membrane protein YgdD (TMEM256/DUF423 family)